jgi:hypothetical protein
MQIRGLQRIDSLRQVRQSGVRWSVVCIRTYQNLPNLPVVS